MTSSKFPTLDARIERWPITGHFTISRGAKTEAVTVVAEVRHDGRIGRGECVPYPRYGETPEYGLASPRSLGAATGSMAVMVDDVDAHYRHCVEHGGTIVYEPVDQPYGFREYSARDPEGGLWSFMRPLD